MSLKGLIQRIEHLAIDDFKAGVEETSGIKAIYIDPKRLHDPDMAKNVANLRQQLERQMPGITGKPGDADYTSDADLEDLVKLVTSEGPFAVRGEYNGKPIGIINKQDWDYDSKNKLMPLIADLPRDKIKPIPGPDYLWDEAVGVHEGAHLNQPDIDDTLPAAEQQRLTIEHEALSDKAAIDFLRSKGRNDMAQALIDYRALGAGRDHNHATAIFLTPGAAINVTAAHVDATGKFRDEMNQGVAKELGISEADAKTLLDKDPRKYIGTVDALLAKNAIGSTPEVKQYMEAFAGAYRRQVIDHMKPEPKKVADAAIGGQDEGTTRLSQYYRTESTTKYGATLVADDPNLGTAVRGGNAGTGFQLTAAWTAAQLADEKAVPGLVPPAAEPVSAPAPAYRNTSAYQAA